MHAALPAPLPHWKRYVALTKPRITMMVVVTGLGGMWLAAKTGAAAGLSWRTALIALGGLAMVVSGAGVLNMYLERDSDGLMIRTAGRPLPAHRLPARSAFQAGRLALGGRVEIECIAAVAE